MQLYLLTNLFCLLHFTVSDSDLFFASFHKASHFLLNHDLQALYAIGAGGQNFVTYSQREFRICDSRVAEGYGGQKSQIQRDILYGQPSPHHLLNLHTGLRVRQLTYCLYRYGEKGEMMGLRLSVPIAQLTLPMLRLELDPCRHFTGSDLTIACSFYTCIQ